MIKNIHTSETQNPVVAYLMQKLKVRGKVYLNKYPWWHKSFTKHPGDKPLDVLFQNRNFSLSVSTTPKIQEPI